MIKHLLFVSLFLLFFASNLFGQQLLGLSTSNYSGIHGIYSNPASITDSRFRFSVNFFSVDGQASNNYVRYNGPSSIFAAMQNDEGFKQEHLEYVSHAKPKLFTSSVDFRGPSLLFTMGAKNSIALSSRVRGSAQMFNISQNIADLIRTGGRSDEFINQVNQDNEFSFNSNVQAELGLTFGREIFNTGAHFLKGGVTVKKITGLYSGHFINRNTSFQVEERYNPAYPEEQEVIVHVNNIDLQYGYLNEDLLQDLNTEKVINWFTKGNAPGKGWGADLGFTYEYRPNMERFHYSANGRDYIDRQKEKYKYRISVALMDLGKVRYENPSYVNSYDIKRTNKEIYLREFYNAEEAEDYARIFNESLDIEATENTSSFDSGLPTALNLNLDYHLAGPFYVNATWIKNLQAKYNIAMQQPSLVALTPRLDTKGLTLALPLSLSNDYQVFAVGGMLKLGPYFIGSDNIGGAFNIGKPYGANVYTGLNLSIGQGKKKNKKAKKGATQQPNTPGSPTISLPAPTPGN